MQIETINTQQDYEDFCDFIESGDYKKLDINIPYVIADNVKFIIAKPYIFVFEDIVAYVTGTPQKEAPAKKAATKIKSTEKVELIPKNIVTVSNIPFNIY
jgi:hypothetical protein